MLYCAVYRTYIIGKIGNCRVRHSKLLVPTDKGPQIESCNLHETNNKTTKQNESTMENTKPLKEDQKLFCTQ
jgi:hypothetical protein